MAISKGWRNIWSINGLELKYAFAMTLWPFTRFFYIIVRGKTIKFLENVLKIQQAMIQIFCQIQIEIPIKLIGLSIMKL